MHFAVDGKLRHFYQSQGCLELEELLSVSSAESLLKEAKAVLKKRASIESYSSSRDLWRESALIKKTTLSRPLAEVVSSLIEKRPLRIGYDELISSNAHLQSATLQEVSSLQGILCGVMLCLQAPSKEKEMADFPLFSTTVGNGVVFSLDFVIKGPEELDGIYLLIVYTQSKAVYVFQENDWQFLSFKKLGYNFGDKLLDAFNPVIYA